MGIVRIAEIEFSLFSAKLLRNVRGIEVAMIGREFF